MIINGYKYQLTIRYNNLWIKVRSDRDERSEDSDIREVLELIFMRSSECHSVYTSDYNTWLLGNEITISLDRLGISLHSMAPDIFLVEHSFKSDSMDNWLDQWKSDLNIKTEWTYMCI